MSYAARSIPRKPHWPRPGSTVSNRRIFSELNEFTISPILEGYEQQLKTSDPPVTVDWAEFKRDRRATYRFLEAALLAWIRGELSDPVIESRADFWQHCRRGVDGLAERLGAGKTAAAVSSSGTISTMVSIALGIDDETAVGLELQMYNASVPRILYDGDRISLASLNNIGHLEARADNSVISFI